MKQKINTFFKKNYCVMIPLLISIILAIISGFVIFRTEFDLYVYNQMMLSMESFIFKDLIKNIFHRGEIISMTYLYAMQKLGLEHYIQVIPTLVFYYIMLYVIIDYSKTNNNNKTTTIIISVVFLSLFKYMDIVTNFRNYLALALFFLAIYLDLIKKQQNKWIYLLYITSSLIHTSLFAMLILRIMIEIKSKYLLKAIIAMMLLTIIFPETLVFILKPVNIDFIKFVVERISFYISEAELYITIQYIFRIMQFIAIAVFSIYGMKKYNNTNEEKYNMLTCIIYIITIVLITRYWIFLRFVTLSLFLSLIPMLNLTNLIDKKTYKFVLYLGILLMIIVGIRIQIPTFVKMFIN